MREYARAKKTPVRVKTTGGYSTTPSLQNDHRTQAKGLRARLVNIVVGFFLDALEYDLSGLVFYELFRLVEIP